MGSIKTNNLVKEFGEKENKVRVLDDINIEIKDGEFVSLMGPYGEKEKDYKERLNEILKIIGLEDKRKSLPRELSERQQQRVSIARAIILNPSILFADEPIGNFDSKSGKEVMELLKKINEEEHITILQVTHSEDSAKYGNKIIRLKDGKIVE